MIKCMDQQYEWEWLRSRAWCIQCADSQGMVCYDKDGNIMAAAAFDSFTAVSCSVHIAIDNPMALRHGFLEAISGHLFGTLRRNRIFGLVPSNNEKAIAFDTKIGFTEVSRIPNACAEGVDYIVMGMEKADCRWLPEDLR